MRNEFHEPKLGPSKARWLQANRLRLIATFSGLGLVIITGLYVAFDFLVLKPMCHNTICQEVLSPDKNLKAVIFERDCSATTSISTQIAVLKANDKLPNEIGNVFIINSVYGTVVTPVTKVKWKSGSALDVMYSPFIKVSKLELHPVVSFGIFHQKKVDVEFRTFEHRN